jgi:hypothetical protein
MPAEMTDRMRVRSKLHVIAPGYTVSLLDPYRPIRQTINRLRANGPFIIADVTISLLEGIRVGHRHSASALAPLTAPGLRHYLELYDPSACNEE